MVSNRVGRGHAATQRETGLPAHRPTPGHTPQARVGSGPKYPDSDPPVDGYPPKSGTLITNIDIIFFDFFSVPMNGLQPDPRAGLAPPADRMVENGCHHRVRRPSFPNTNFTPGPQLRLRVRRQPKKGLPGFAKTTRKGAPPAPLRGPAPNCTRGVFRPVRIGWYECFPDSGPGSGRLRKSSAGKTSKMAQLVTQGSEMKTDTTVAFSDPDIPPELGLVRFAFRSQTAGTTSF